MNVKEMDKVSSKEVKAMIKEGRNDDFMKLANSLTESIAPMLVDKMPKVAKESPEKIGELAKELVKAKLQRIVSL